MALFPGMTTDNIREAVNPPNYNGENAYYGVIQLEYDIENGLKDVQKDIKEARMMSLVKGTNEECQKKLEDDIDRLTEWMKDVDSFYEEIERLEPENLRKTVLQTNMLRKLKQLKERIENMLPKLMVYYGGAIRIKKRGAKKHTMKKQRQRRTQRQKQKQRRTRKN
jgi:predicted nuclease with TOPRIM domain